MSWSSDFAWLAKLRASRRATRAYPMLMIACNPDASLDLEAGKAKDLDSSGQGGLARQIPRRYVLRVAGLLP
jgi:hypothetical protein